MGGAFPVFDQTACQHVTPRIVEVCPVVPGEDIDESLRIAKWKRYLVSPSHVLSP